MACGAAVPSTPIEFVSRLTEQDVTPGTLAHRLFDPGRAGGAAHAGHIVLCHCVFLGSVKLRLGCALFTHFMSFCKRRHQLVDRLVPAGADILRHAGADVCGKQLLVEGVDRRVDRRGLH